MNEPDPSFSGTTGDMHPPGWYTYPNGLKKYIPYPFVPGRTPLISNPGLINVEESENEDK